METKVAQVADLHADSRTIREAAQLLATGRLVVFPTETVYGIGANALDADAVAGIFAAKGRPQDNPLIAHVTALDDIFPLVADFPESARRLAEAFWPGPLTIILPKSDAVPLQTSGGLDTVAIRMPSHPVARAIIRQAGVPVAAPSANRSGGPSPTTAKHCIADLTGRVDMIVDGGECEVGLESTVLSLAGSVPRLLRPGAVTVSQLRKVLGEVEVDAAVTHQLEAGVAVRSPGLKYKHYAPKASMTLVHADKSRFHAFAEEKRGEAVWFLVFEEDLNAMKAMGANALAYGEEHSHSSQAKRLFSALRELDTAGAQTVYARAPSASGVGLAIYNRMLRAAGFHEIYL
ncbi:threonylcarbamoyl-AMP synthase [Ruminococcaceae bacterium OttesenSCG-928-L11]|nr:threonylcarbamoyl-AMP synthase [Ruminococcaceae bacterium OttesenSCG-928-L11]